MICINQMLSPPLDLSWHCFACGYRVIVAKSFKSIAKRHIILEPWEMYLSSFLPWAFEDIS
jgi:hypothetical protein